MKLNKYVFFVDRKICLLLLSVDNMKYYALEGLSRDMVLSLRRLERCNRNTLFGDIVKSNSYAETVSDEQMLDVYNRLIKLKIIKE